MARKDCQAPKVQQFRFRGGLGEAIPKLPASGHLGPCAWLNPYPFYPMVLWDTLHAVTSATWLWLLHQKFDLLYTRTHANQNVSDVL